LRLRAPLRATGWRVRAPGPRRFSALIRIGLSGYDRNRLPTLFSMLARGSFRFLPPFVTNKSSPSSARWTGTGPQYLPILALIHIWLPGYNRNRAPSHFSILVAILISWYPSGSSNFLHGYLRIRAPLRSTGWRVRGPGPRRFSALIRIGLSGYDRNRLPTLFSMLARGSFRFLPRLLRIRAPLRASGGPARDPGTYPFSALIRIWLPGYNRNRAPSHFSILVAILISWYPSGSFNFLHGYLRIRAPLRSPGWRVRGPGPRRFSALIRIGLSGYDRNRLPRLIGMLALGSFRFLHR
jgi:hypothetical protein